MIGELTNHLWQSTLFAITAGLMTVALRKNRAQIRYWLWLSASLKFLIPFSLLMGLGSHLVWAPAVKRMATQAVSGAMVQIAQPFPDIIPPAPGTVSWIPTVIFGVWVCGTGLIALMRLRGWLRVREAVRSSVPLELSTTIEARSSPGLLEPGVVGILHPILLLPAGIVERLTPGQLEAVLAHELCHVRRRDNLTAAIHMIVEALFWFHPLIWWIGARLVEERERACDADVLRLGGEAEVYAEAILSVCKYYVESPLVCVSGITGSDLKKRIESIMAQHIAQNLNLTRKLLLTVGGIAAVIAPIAIGLRAQSPVRTEFDVVSIKPSAPDDHNGFMFGLQPGGLRAMGTPLKMLIMQAYDVKAFQVSDGPSWISTERWDVLAKVGSAEGRISVTEMRPMLQALLRDRFHLTTHNETKEMPVFALEIGKNGPKLVPHTGTEQFNFGEGSLVVKKGGTEALAAWLSRNLGRVVIDKTGLKGEYDYQLEWTPDPGQGGPQSIGLPPAAPPPHVDTNGPSIFTAVQEQLGLRLASQKGPVEIIVIDSVDKPSAN